LTSSAHQYTLAITADISIRLSTIYLKDLT
jgi:hypothetical protein